MRTITISCPSCGTEFKHVTMDTAEGILFHGCTACRDASRAPQQFGVGRGEGGATTDNGEGSVG